MQLKGYILGTFVIRSVTDAYKNQILYILLKPGVSKENKFSSVVLHPIYSSKATAAWKTTHHLISILLIISWKLVRTFQTYQVSKTNLPAMSLQRGIKARTYLVQCLM